MLNDGADIVRMATLKEWVHTFVVMRMMITATVARKSTAAENKTNGGVSVN